ncbi:MAG: hypothetical protein HY795_16390 [Desulfovibrio sp.]|nr:hypothetical protein [Desulfovibrio sp.]MBI4959170.1 hypothetical protein [Desulfovibrio sp.]
MSKSLPKHLTGVGLALVFAGLVISLRRIALWKEHYSGGGTLYPFNNCLKLAFFALVCWQLYAVGRFILGKWRAGNALRQSVVCLLCGMGIVSISIHGLGLLHIMYFPVVFISSLAVIALSGPLFCDAVSGAWEKLATLRNETIVTTALSVVLWLVAGAIFLYMAMAKGIYPDVITMDTVGHYLPFFRDSLSMGSLDIFPYFVNFYISKGAGLSFFFAALSDVQSLQLASLTAILLICLILAGVVRALDSGPSFLAPAAVVTFLSVSDLYQLEFQKQHALVAGLIFGQWLILLLLLTCRNNNCSGLFFAGIINALHLVILLPAAALTILTPLTVLALVASLWTKHPGNRWIFCLFVLTLFTPLALYISYNTMLGLADLNPAHFFNKFRDETVLARHIDVQALDFLLSVQNYDSKVAASASFLLDRFLHVNPLDYWWSRQLPPLWLVATVFLLAVWHLRRTGGAGTLAWTVAGGAFSLQFMAYALNLAVKQESFALSRMGFFVYAPMIMLYSLSAVVTCRAAEDWFGLKKNTGAVQAFVAMAMILLALTRFPHNLGDDVRETLEFFTGKASYELRYSRVHREIPACLAFSAITDGEAITPLYYAAGCYGLPLRIFRPPYFDTQDKNFTALVREDADSEGQLLRAGNRIYFSVSLVANPSPYLYLPLFAPESIAARFSVVASHGDDTFLLRLGGPGDPVAMREFLPRYALYREAHNNGREATTMDRFRSSLPPAPNQ